MKPKASFGNQFRNKLLTILAELDDLGKFNHVREVVAFIGLAPRETISGSSERKRQEWQNNRLCYYAQVGSYYLWCPEIRQNARSKL